jgi:hypothetical protein
MYVYTEQSVLLRNGLFDLIFDPGSICAPVLVISGIPEADLVEKAGQAAAI